ncbi:type VII secretion target [Mycolicibacter sinensis]|nr:type VII secretion target [Mycolicibacter sinensis]
MTSPTPLQVTPDGLRAAAQRCEALAATVTPTLPAVTVSAWQSTAAATSAANAGMSTTGTACKSRMIANAAKLTRAASAYQNQDDHGAERLTAVGSHLPAGSGGDGGAGGLPRSFTPLVPRGFGVDGGAAGGPK